MSNHSEQFLRELLPKLELQHKATAVLITDVRRHLQAADDGGCPHRKTRDVTTARGPDRLLCLECGKSILVQEGTESQEGVADA